MKRYTKNILAIAPGDGWVGVYFLPAAPWVETWSVAVWTLAEITEDGDTTRSVEGLTGGDFLLEMEAEKNFYIYAHTRDLTPEHWAEWVKLAQARVSPAPSPGGGGGR